MIFDPGASKTTITPQVAKAIGFQKQRGTYRKVGVVTASRHEEVINFVVPEVQLGGQTVAGLEVVSMRLPKAVGARGLLGLNFLRHFKILLDFGKGEVTFNRLRTTRAAS